MPSVPIQPPGSSPQVSRSPLSGATAGASLAPGYAILFMDGATEKQGRSGLSHADAMADAEELQRKGKVVRIMHVLGTRSYEVDHYPPR
jgi:hypothetical protein